MKPSIGRMLGFVSGSCPVVWVTGFVSDSCPGSCLVSVWVRVGFVSCSCLVRVRFVSGSCLGSWVRSWFVSGRVWFVFGSCLVRICCVCVCFVSVSGSFRVWFGSGFVICSYILIRIQSYSRQLV